MTTRYQVALVEFEISDDDEKTVRSFTNLTEEPSPTPMSDNEFMDLSDEVNYALRWGF